MIIIIIMIKEESTKIVKFISNGSVFLVLEFGSNNYMVNSLINLILYYLAAKKILKTLLGWVIVFLHKLRSS